jgi:hypothetical protein
MLHELRKTPRNQQIDVLLHPTRGQASDEHA